MHQWVRMQSTWWPRQWGHERCILVFTDWKWWWWWWLVCHRWCVIWSCREMVQDWALGMYHRWWYKNVRWGGCKLMYMQ